MSFIDTYYAFSLPLSTVCELQLCTQTYYVPGWCTAPAAIADPRIPCRCMLFPHMTKTGFLRTIPRSRCVFTRGLKIV